MNWSRYEEVVKDIYEKLGGAQGVETICWGRDCKVMGKSGVEHQIDVHTKHSDGLHTYHTAIECKYWNRRRPKDDVTKLAAIIEDAGIDKGVIVSKKGFTPDAIALAKYRNISLVELREPTEEDWQGRIKDFHLRFTARVPVPTEFRFDIVRAEADQRDQIDREIDPSQVIVVEPSCPEQNLYDLINLLISKPDRKQSEGTLIRHVFKPETVFRTEGAPPMKVTAIQFVLHFETSKWESVLSGEERVAMILISLFDKKRFVISSEGDIRESDV